MFSVSFGPMGIPMMRCRSIPNCSVSGCCARWLKALRLHGCLRLKALQLSHHLLNRVQVSINCWDSCGVMMLSAIALCMLDW